MKAITGIFKEIDATAKAVAKLRELVADKDINVLTPASRKAEVAAVPTDTGMAPVGGPLGATLGMAIGIAAVIPIPGVGLVTAIGMAWGLVLGTVGGVAGWIVGDKADHALTGGVPTEELFFYEEAIRDGHSVVLVFARDQATVRKVKAVFENSGAIGIDAARDTWWIGMRDAEWAEWAKHNHETKTEFDAIEEDFLRGFTTALRPEYRDLEFSAARKRLPAAEIKGDHKLEVFQKGYERGRRYLSTIRPAIQPANKSASAENG